MSLLESTIARLPHSDDSTGIVSAVAAHWDSLTKPRGSLGRLESEVSTLARIQNSPSPHIHHPAIYVFCGDHRITEENVSPYPSAVTREMVKNFVAGGAAINVLCRNLGIETVVVDAGVSGPKISGALDRRVADGANNFLKGPAMTPAQARSAVELGVVLAHEAALKFDIVGVGEMGIGNSTSASALLSAFLGTDPVISVGPGAGLDGAGLDHKRSIVAAALLQHQDTLKNSNPLGILALFGGFEIAMMTGFLLGSAAHRLPVVLDGFICGAAFIAAQALCPSMANYVLFAHRSAEPGHTALLNSTGRKPMLDLELRLGEGTGAALAIALLRSAVQLYHEMATFEQAAVSDLKTKETSV